MAEAGLHYRVVGKHVAVIQLAGNYQVAESLKLVRDCLSDPRVTLPADLLVDVRRSTTKRSNEELQQIAYALSAWASQIGQIAVVTESKLYYGLARMVMAYMEGSGIRLDISFDYEATLRRLQVTAPPTSLQ